MKKLNNIIPYILIILLNIVFLFINVSIMMQNKEYSKQLKEQETNYYSLEVYTINDMFTITSKDNKLYKLSSEISYGYIIEGTKEDCLRALERLSYVDERLQKIEDETDPYEYNKKVTEAYKALLN